MAAVHAEEVLRERGGSLSAEALAYYMRRAGRDETATQKAAARRVLEESRERRK